MPLIVKDRVKESSTTTGTGTLTLAGAAVGFETFSASIGNANTTYYAIVGGAEFEVGLGTVAAGTLARTTVLQSSNADALVNFSAGSKDVFCTYAADKAVYLDGSGNVGALGTITSGVATNLTGTAASLTAGGNALLAGSATQAFSATTAAAGTNTTQVATTAFFQASAAISSWPIGSVFIAVVATNPNTLLGGGTWAAFGAGRVMVGIDTGQAEFNVVEEVGGAKTHTLTTAEMPSHTHPYVSYQATGGGLPAASATATNSVTNATVATGGGAAHNNLQPYIVCYFWKRTA